MAFKSVKTASKIVFSSRKYIILGIVSFILFFTLYIFTLPATYTGGRIGIISLRLLTVKLGFFSLLMASPIAFIIPFTLFSLKQGMGARKASTTGGLLGSILPPLVCCSPLIPGLIALLGITSSVAFGISGAIQGFIATNETYIFIGAILLLFYALVQGAKSIMGCVC